MKISRIEITVTDNTTKGEWWNEEERINLWEEDDKAKASVLLATFSPFGSLDNGRGEVATMLAKKSLEYQQFHSLPDEAEKKARLAKEMLIHLWEMDEENPSAVTFWLHGIRIETPTSGTAIWAVQGGRNVIVDFGGEGSEYRAQTILTELFLLQKEKGVKSFFQTYDSSGEEISWCEVKKELLIVHKGQLDYLQELATPVDYTNEHIQNEGRIITLLTDD